MVDLTENYSYFSFEYSDTEFVFATYIDDRKSHYRLILPERFSQIATLLAVNQQLCGHSGFQRGLHFREYVIAESC